MSAISEINKVWLQKFPGSSLPEAWAEDVKTNLSKHKKRVMELEEELEQEKIYVEFLETLLAEVSQGMSPIQQQPSHNSTSSTQEMDDVIKDTLERRSLVATTHDSLIDFSAFQQITTPDGGEDLNSSTGSIFEESKARQEELELVENSVEGGITATEDDSHANDENRDHFVTVIEVNGFDKKRINKLPASQNLNKSNEEESKRLKKIPPRPPPKFPKRQTSDPPSPRIHDGPSPLRNHEVLDPNGRPIVFDSRKLSIGTEIQKLSDEVTTPGETKPPPLPIHCTPTKRFEGSKLPLPPCDGIQQETRTNSSSSPEIRATSKGRQAVDDVEVPPGRSKILDLVSRMESNQKSSQQSSKPSELPPPRRSSFRKPFQGPSVYQKTEPVVSDYVDPCDAEFDGGNCNDQIYDSPPPEDEFEFEHHSPPGTHSKGNSTDPRMSESGVVDPSSIDNEPMYDTVAPDQDDDYVLLTEEGNQTCSSTNSLTKREGDMSLSHHHNNNEIATIRSQTSVLSGHSVATTTSSGGTTSDTDGISGSPLHDPSIGRDLSHKDSVANYVNIEYFLSKAGRKGSSHSVDSDEEDPSLLDSVSLDPDSEIRLDSTNDSFSMDSGVFGGGTSDSGGAFGCFSNTSGSGSSRHGNSDATTLTAADQEKLGRFRYLLINIAESESSYVDVLNFLLQYMRALKATLSTSKFMSHDEFNIIFYKIPELYELHQKFLIGLKEKSGTNVGQHFLTLAQDIWVYGAFLQNYSRAVETVRKCSQNSAGFSEVAKDIRLKSLQNQKVTLETLLYSPVSRVQKNTEIIQDLLKCLPFGHPDEIGLRSALREFQSFLTEFKMIQPEQLFQGQDRNPRHLVKNSFIVELSEGHRKLRHIFLFNDVFVCAKYKTGKTEKFTFELKWYIPIGELVVLEENSEPKESTVVNLVALRSQASTVRDQIKRQTSRDDPKKAKAEKHRKKLAELEAQLVLASPNLVFKIKATNGRCYTFFLSSEFERSQWVDAIDALRANQPTSGIQISMQEMQTWFTSSRKHLKTNMGSYLLRTGHDENLLLGDLYILIEQLKGIQRSADLYICIEVDSYGHFFRKAKTKMICESVAPCWNQDFTVELEGAQNLRILLYEDHQRQGTLIRAKATIELNKSWLTGTMTERRIDLQDYVLTLFTKFTPSEMTIRRVPTAKPTGLFGAKITQVCKREKRQVPFIMTSCLREVERRGMNEVGIYRVSGSTSDVSKLKKAFETNSYEAEQLLKEVDIHSVTGILKLYLRELPEALFTDDLYPRFFEAFSQPDQEMKRSMLLQLFATLQPINQHIILSLLDHMCRVNKHENHNKMSLHNIATVFGPTLLRPGAKNEIPIGSIDLLTSGTACAGILYFFLIRRAAGESMQIQQSSSGP